MVCKLLVLVAVLMMPLGMVSAVGGPHHQQMAGMPMQHHPDQGSRSESKSGLGECTMACSAALPAMEAVRHVPLLRASDPLQSAAAQRLHGLHPETAVPPPKLS